MSLEASKLLQRSVALGATLFGPVLGPAGRLQGQDSQVENKRVMEDQPSGSDVRVCCTLCSAEANPSAIDPNTKIGSCAACGESFDASHQLAGRFFPPPTKGPLEPSQAVRLVKQDTVFSIDYKWSTKGRLENTVSLVFLGGVLAYLGMTTLQNPEPSVTLFFIPVFAFLSYHQLAQAMNSTRVELGQGNLSLRHGPLPWRGNLRIPADQIKQLAVAVTRSPSSRQKRYTLETILSDGSRRKLTPHSLKPDDFLFMERALEERLNLKDRFVKGAARG